MELPSGGSTPSAFSVGYASGGEKGFDLDQLHLLDCAANEPQCDGNGFELDQLHLLDCAANEPQ